MSDRRKADRLEHLKAMRAAPCGCDMCERAGIYEFDAGLSRVAAERLAAGVAELEREVGSLRAADRGWQGRGMA